jgi:ribosomal protein S12 methylthiotransferase
MSFDKRNITLLPLGCPKNQVDSEILLGQLNGNRFQYTDNPNLADILIINTCSFIQDAIRESVDEIFSGIQWKQEKPGRKLLVVGCLPQRFPDGLTTEMPEVDGFFGVGDFQGIVESLEDWTGNGVRWGHLTPQNGPGHLTPQNGPGHLTPQNGPGHLTPRIGQGHLTPQEYFLNRRLLSFPHTAYLRISDGCSQGCRYCTIPRIRGPHRSREPDDILQEAEKLASNGVKELVVIGQETTSYGTDLEPRTDLSTLLHGLSRIEGIHWIRLMYTHPPTLTDDMIRGFGKVEGLCAYLDFPIEHASDRILEAMGRKTTKVRLRQQIQLLREVIPDVALRTSIIVGYPGEGESEFSELIDFLDEIRFDHLGVFTFSPEEGTPAKDLPSAVSSEEAQDRRDQIMMLSEDWKEERNQQKIGQRLEVLVDDVDIRQDASAARTQWDAPEIDGLVIVQKVLKPGKFETVIVTGYQGHDLLAKLTT